MKIIKLAALFSLVFASFCLLTACDSRELTEAKTTAWYKEHSKERMLKLEECNQDVNKRIETDCQHAIQSHIDIIIYGK